MKTLFALIPILALGACQQRVINGDDLTDGSYASRQSQPALGTGTRGYQANNPEDDGVYDEYGRLVSVDPSSYTSQFQADPDRIVLSDYSQEQQKRDREEYARQLDAIEASRVEIQAGNVPNVDTTISVGQYARTTTNRLGVKTYARSGFRNGCRKFSSATAAQREFLKNGGPASDPLGLDKDGDGFACEFDPGFYRQVSSY